METIATLRIRLLNSVYHQCLYLNVDIFTTCIKLYIKHVCNISALVNRLIGVFLHAILTILHLLQNNVIQNYTHVAVISLLVVGDYDIFYIFIFACAFIIIQLNYVKIWRSG